MFFFYFYMWCGLFLVYSIVFNGRYWNVLIIMVKENFIEKKKVVFLIEKV